ncbi:hypothetical protein REPUB_Repub13aG0020500 [Reevesia pubescens]
MMMKGVTLAADIRRNLGVIKVRDVTVAAHGLTKDAFHHIKTHLVDILPSLSLAITTKMVDDAEKKANEEQETEGENEGDEPRQDAHQLSGKSQFVSPASSLFALNKPLSRL